MQPESPNANSTPCATCSSRWATTSPWMTALSLPMMSVRRRRTRHRSGPYPGLSQTLTSVKEKRRMPDEYYYSQWHHHRRFHDEYGCQLHERPHGRRHKRLADIRYCQQKASDNRWERYGVLLQWPDAI